MRIAALSRRSAVCDPTGAPEVAVSDVTRGGQKGASGTASQVTTRMADATASVTPAAERNATGEHGVSRDLARLRPRHRAGLWVLGVATMLLAVANLQTHSGDALVWLVRLAAPGSTIVAYGLLGRARTRASVSTHIVAEMGIVIALGALGAYLAGQLTPETLASNPGRLLTVVLAFVCAMTLPWGAWAQGSLCLLIYLIDVVTSRVVLGDFTGIPSVSGVAMLVSLVASVYVVHQLDLHRRRRDRAEAELRQAKDAAEAANCAKGQFLANVSHEIRTPLNVVVGMIVMVLDSDVSAEHRNTLKRARAASMSLLAIINDILDSAKIEAGKMTLEVVDLDLRRTIEETLSLLAPAAEQKGLSFTAAIPPSLPRHVRGDPVRLRQVLVNLLGNAVKFTAAGGVVLEVGTPVDVAAGSSCLFQFSVRDSGTGIGPDQLGRIFEPFEQGDGSTTRRYGGTGLGLSISANLVALMGGGIWVESEVGRGTTFHFTARFEIPEESPHARSEPTPLAADA